MLHPIRIALIGAGIFAHNAHLPALLAMPDRFHIAAVYSRTEERARALVERIPYPADAMTDLAALLARNDVDAVDILLPIDQLPSAVDMALAAGKHVISEKPIAPDIATGRRLLRVHAHHPDQVWMVAENWRYEEAFQQAGMLVRSGAIGRPLALSWSLHIPMREGNKYYGTAWRRSGSFPGGFLLDGGVHHVAALRMVAGEIASVSAMTAQMHADLPPADTLSAALEFESGLIGHYAASYTAASPFPSYLTIVGERGAIQCDRGYLALRTDERDETRELGESRSVNRELLAFAEAIERGAPHLNTPASALQDVAVVEAMLRSSQEGRRFPVEKIEKRIEA